MSTLTYMYADQTAVLGPLATYAEPHAYDLCAEHAVGLTAPVGWDVVRLITEFPQVAEDDFFDLADATCEIGEAEVDPEPTVTRTVAHLRVLGDTSTDGSR